MSSPEILRGIAAGYLTEATETAAGLMSAADKAAMMGLSAVGVEPLGGTSDDWPTVIGTANANAYGSAVLLKPGTYLCKTKVALVSGARIIGGPGVRIVQSLTPTGGADPESSAFHSSTGATGTQTTFSAASVPGAITISLAASFPVGTILRINGVTNSFHASTRIVTAVSGSGPYSVTLDEPLYEEYFASDQASAVASIPTDIWIIGNGMRMSGTGGRFVELGGAWRCNVEGIIIDTTDGSPDEYCFSYDIGSRGSRFADLEIDGGLHADSGIANEGSDRILNERCRVQRVKSNGIAILASKVGSVVDCTTWKNGSGGGGNGIYLGADVSSRGCTGYVIERSRSYANAIAGISVQHGSQGTRISDCAVGGNGTAGDLYTTCDADIDGLHVRGAATHAMQMQGGRVRAVHVDVDSSSADNVVLIDSTSHLKMSDSRIKGATGGNAIGSVGGDLDLRNVRLDGSSTGITSVGGTVRHFGLDADGCTTPISLSGGAVQNVGTVTLNGASAVDYTFPIRSTEPVKLSRKTAGGTPGPAPTFVVTAGTKVAVTGTALDTSVYQIEIG